MKVAIRGLTAASFVHSCRPQLPSTVCGGLAATWEAAEGMGRAKRGGKDEGEGRHCEGGLGTK